MKTNRREAAEYRLKMADGKYRWHLARAFPIYDEDGKLIRWVGTTTDIEKQKEVEVYQSRLLQVMDSSSDFIGMADTDGRGIYLNKAACQLVGLDSSLKPNDVQILDFFMERDREYVIGTILPTTKLEGKWVGEFRFRHFQTGLPIWVHYNSFVTYDLESGKPTGFATVARDIGELKKKEHAPDVVIIRVRDDGEVTGNIRKPRTKNTCSHELLLEYERNYCNQGQHNK
jgi:PAS domain S-box-containing protein